ncbi:unnamed protein product [Lactuca virosa]|uniref:beta-galactosidase n=1 Tax=Lactuca virosa TaxID=75947 RepID=A0AAU9N1N9_9ASTR|nr:unnamed protein product [Lactuca virosa]
MQEEDHGILWKHQDWRTGLAEVRSSKHLTISFICTLRIMNMVFIGTFTRMARLKLKLKYGTTIAPGLYSQVHQHFFVARMDMAGDCKRGEPYNKMWPDLIQKEKEGELDVIQTYVFWNGHEPQPCQYYFEDRYDLVKFIKLIKKAGLYAHLRVGPYACAEWNFRGFPIWFKYVPGITFRTDNGPFENHYK